jgi:uncharacterized protein YeaO (DUF488 family)
MIEIKRVYEGGETRGKRFLVERLWPGRGAGHGTSEMVRA